MIFRSITSRSSVFICAIISSLPFPINSFSLFGGNSTERPLMCYRGIKYFVGQEEIDDNVRCELNLLEKAMPGMEKYCYKFVSHTGITDFVKRGCSVVICSVRPKIKLKKS
ncbi:hypothetical protein GPALN_012821 [Globodera pallida]|nr:hypothetical protein GPALN_012821 [Globodera pallida]